ncbi:mycofactocin-coupled SDR family oxidoreductase [Frankia sp. AiPs1]|uniref:mycofactocin-coupled SDR family oxidoreductase n=1 Tax=Frankia sp. AiPs1 TaxID=573493 RepID=UPI002044C12A|nr:mycofactocin-coupled SDR family oxidoreductase [Frankia sp. AiPs1]MCM3921799.1 mycofactocin-coupled SDR family oxidoreductase [Frankia sp. AiPs1]
MGKLDGKVAFITGVARGQGRSHALALAEEGADIIGVDICAQVDTVNYPMSTPDDLAETVKLVEDRGRRIIARLGDVRDLVLLRDVVAEGVADLGRLDIVLANAGIMTHGLDPADRSVQAWDDGIGVILTGTWNTLQATVPALVEGGRGGSIVITSSSAGIKAGWTDTHGGFDSYIAAKFAVVGLMRAYAGRLAEHSIRVNTVHPTGVATPMVVNEFFSAYMQRYPHIAGRSQNALPVPVIEPIDISRAVLYLVSDDGRYVTGTTHVVDAGMTSVAS